MNELSILDEWERRTRRLRRDVLIGVTAAFAAAFALHYGMGDPAVVAQAQPAAKTAAPEPLAAASGAPARAGSGTPVAITTAAVERAQASTSILLDAELVSLSSPSVQAELSGQVREVRTVPGQRVARGEVLAVLDDSDAQLTLREARSMATQARSLASERAQDLARNEKLAAQEYISRVQLQASRTQAEVARAQLAGADARVAQAQRLVEKATVRAPFDAVVLEQKIATGATVRAGEPLFQLFGSGEMTLVARAPQALVGRIVTGQGAMVRWGELRLPTSVKRVSPVLNAASRSFDVHLAVPEGLAGLPGAALTVALEQAQTAQLRVPAQAVQLAGDDAFVYVVEDARAKRRSITVSTQQAASAYVDSGLREGETVVVEGASFLRHDAPVQVAPAAHVRAAAPSSLAGAR